MLKTYGLIVDTDFYELIIRTIYYFCQKAFKRMHYGEGKGATSCSTLQQLFEFHFPTGHANELFVDYDCIYLSTNTTLDIVSKYRLLLSFSFPVPPVSDIVSD